jgi:galactokinase
VGRRLTAAFTVFSPGRVNLIGEHTDYNDGLCLPFAIDRGLTVSAEPLEANEVQAHTHDLDSSDRFPLDSIEPAGGWRRYVRGVAAELIAAGHPLRGARIAIRSDLPAGGGLASSAALTIAVAHALLVRAEQSPPDAAVLAQICARAESRWAGAETGLLDQLAILCARPGQALLIDAAALAVEPVPLALAGWKLWLLDSGARHEHGSGGYNERRAECRAACAQLGVRTLRDASPGNVGRLADPLDRRVRHVLTENERVERMVAALRRADPEEVGRLLDEGHASLRDDYEVSVPAVEDAVERLHAAGARGARMVGGGFGGQVLGLFPPGVRPPSSAVPVSAGAGVQIE